MTCGINLGLLLVGLLQTVHLCCSWTILEGKGPHTHVGPSDVHGRPDDGSRPQDEFRQGYAVKSGIPPPDFNKGLSPLQLPHTASLSRHYPSVRHFPQPQWRGVDSSVNVPWSGQGTRRTSQDAAGKSKFQSPSSKGSYLFSSGPQSWPAAWEPGRVAKMHRKPDSSAQLTGLKNDDITPQKEYIQETSGVARGRRVNGNKGKKKTNQYSQSNPIINNIQERYEIPLSRHFGLSHSYQGPAYNQNPALHTASYGGGGQRFAPTRVHQVPHRFGGHPIKRLGEEEMVVVKMTTHAPVTRPVHTFPTRPTESYRPRKPSVHQKSKWLRIRSNQLTGGARVLG